MFSDPFRHSSERDDTLLAGTADLQITSIVSLLAIALLVAPLDAPTVLNALVAIPLFCFLPGYALLAALFPARAAKESPDRTRPTGAPPVLDRLALSVAVSLATVPIVGIAGSPLWGIDASRTLVVLGGVTIVAAVVAAVRRAGIPSHRRFAPLTSVGAVMPRSSSSQLLVATAVLGVLIAGASVAYAAGTDDPASTEFYLVNESEGGVALDGGAGPDDTRPVAIDHHADEPANYTVVVRQHSSETGATEILRETVSVSGPERVVISGPGTTADVDRIEYLLYEEEPSEEPDPQDAIRRLWVTTDSDS